MEFRVLSEVRSVQMQRTERRWSSMAVVLLGEYECPFWFPCSLLRCPPTKPPVVVSEKRFVSAFSGGVSSDRHDRCFEKTNSCPLRTTHCGYPMKKQTIPSIDVGGAEKHATSACSTCYLYCCC